jgi:serine/threonine protein kinase
VGKDLPLSVPSLDYRTAKISRFLRARFTLDIQTAITMPPEKLGRYEILRELGHGAMGVVYEALDPTIGRRIALKAIRFDGIGTTADEAARRFKNEARAAGGLNHPNLVTVYDAGEDAGNLYLAMEFIEGSNLDELLRTQRTLSPHKTIEIVRQICLGLDFAHSKGIVHRDIKPANVMLSANGLVKVTDFGIARAGEAMTLTGQVIGTPNYMSPEQVLGKTLDGRSDLFSVGVMLYEMITGERPFEGQSITTIMYKIVHEIPIPPLKLDSSIHAGLSAVIEKSLNKAPEGRFQTGADLMKALENYKTAPIAPVSVLDLPTREFPIPPEVNVKPSPSSAPAVQPDPTPPASTQTTVARIGDWFAGLSPKSKKRIWALAIFFAIFLISRYRSHEPNRENPSTSRETPSSVPGAIPPPPAPGASATPEETTEDANSRPPGLNERENATASKDTALLKVNSTPPSAQVEIDGKPTGKTTPTELQLPRGQHSVRVRMSGFMPSSASFRVKGGEEIEYSPQLSVALGNVPMPNISMPDLSELKNLAKQGQQGEFWQKWARQNYGDKAYGDKARLMINSSPLGARILIDGKDSGETTPAMIPMKPGTYHVRLELDGFEPAERDLTVQVRKAGAWNPALMHSRPQE